MEPQATDKTAGGRNPLSDGDLVHAQEPVQNGEAFQDRTPPRDPKPARVRTAQQPGKAQQPVKGQQIRKGQPARPQTEGVLRAKKFAPQGSGGKQLAQVMGAMFGVVIILVLLAIWAAHNG